MAQMPGFFLLVIVGVILSTLTIVLIFIIINVCIGKQAARKRAQQSRQIHSHLNQEHLFPAYADVEQKPPPLPSRDQFLSESSSHSYEKVETSLNPMKVENQSSLPPQPAFIQHCKTQLVDDVKSVDESYDDVEQLNKNESQSYEDVASLPEYLELDDELPALQQPQLLSSQNCSRESMASYDDVGQLDNDSEDYDDVG